MRNTKRSTLLLAGLGLASLAMASETYANNNILKNSGFDSNFSDWVTSENWEGNTATFSRAIKNGGACLDISSSGENPWDVVLRQNLLTLEPETYTYEFDVWATQPTNFEFSIVTQLGGWTGIHTPSAFSATTTPKTETGTFTTSGTFNNVEFDFRMGGNLTPDNTEICFDNIKVTCPTCAPTVTVDRFTPVHLNQMGYLPSSDKIATYALDDSSTNAPKTWRLLQGTQEAIDDDTAQVVMSGQTQAFSSGVDAASGKRLHTVDFSSVTAVAGNYVLEVIDGTDRHLSHMFAIDSDLYTELKYDALSYFYHARVGQPIETQYVGPDLARDAGHVYDNNLDTLSCIRTQEQSLFECITGIDASGGWYDAGDHGKYVVNAGISIWTLLNQYERSTYLGANADDIADGTMQIPESSNGLSDLLDEARVGLEWVMKMQIPAGSTNAGMVYHKLHDDQWTATAFNPADATATANPRHIWAPSTSATLNFAALGAICYRVYKDIDADFANMCLSKAKTAYAAARNTPYLRSPFTDFSGDGGGQYEDLPGDRAAAAADLIQDEFYWAATELFIASSIKGEDASGFQSDMQGDSQYHLALPTTDPQTSMTWAHVSGLGTMSLATVGDRFGLNPSWVASARQAVIQRANQYVAESDSGSFNVPFDTSITYWGSNSVVLNNLLVMGLARDFSACTDDSYLQAMQHGMSYLLGHNPMSKSYITGYGEDAVLNPHNRYWAHSLSTVLPEPPSGILVGGPNTQFDGDPAINPDDLAGCSPLTCWVDDVEAFTSNEITINWNSPLAWAAAYLDEAASGRTPQACGGLVSLPSTVTLNANGNGSLDLNALNGLSASASFQIVTQPQFGAISISGGIATYSSNSVPTADSFTYIVSLNGVTSAPATVTIQPTTVDGGLSCTWTLTNDVNQYNGFWEASVLIENNTSSVIDGWNIDVVVGPNNEVGSRYYDTGAVFKSGSVNGESVWTISDSDWNSTIPAGSNINIVMVGFDPGPMHWEPGHTGYTPADIRSLGGDCSAPATKSVDITEFQPYPAGATLTANSQIILRWYNETSSSVYIEDESGNKLDLNGGTFSDSSNPLIGQVWIVEGPNVGPTNTRMETNIYALAQFTDLDMSEGTHTWTIKTGSGLAEETSSSITFEITGDNALRCDNNQFYTNGNQWRERLTLLNVGYSEVDDWSITLEWPTDIPGIEPAQILNLYNSNQFTVTKVNDHEYRFDAGTGGAIAPGQTLMDVIYRGINSSTHWRAKDPTISVNPGGVNCSF